MRRSFQVARRLWNARRVRRPLTRAKRSPSRSRFSNTSRSNSALRVRRLGAARLRGKSHDFRPRFSWLALVALGISILSVLFAWSADYQMRLAAQHSLEDQCVRVLQEERDSVASLVDHVNVSHRTPELVDRAFVIGALDRVETACVATKLLETSPDLVQALEDRGARLIRAWPLGMQAGEPLVLLTSEPEVNNLKTEDGWFRVLGAARLVIDSRPEPSWLPWQTRPNLELAIPECVAVGSIDEPCW